MPHNLLPRWVFFVMIHLSLGVFFSTVQMELGVSVSHVIQLLIKRRDKERERLMNEWDSVGHGYENRGERQLINMGITILTICFALTFLVISSRTSHESVMSLCPSFLRIFFILVTRVSETERNIVIVDHPTFWPQESLTRKALPKSFALCMSPWMHLHLNIWFFLSLVWSLSLNSRTCFVHDSWTWFSSSLDSSWICFHFYFFLSRRVLSWMLLTTVVSTTGNMKLSEDTVWIEWRKWVTLLLFLSSSFYFSSTFISLFSVDWCRVFCGISDFLSHSMSRSLYIRRCLSFYSLSLFHCHSRDIGMRLVRVTDTDRIMRFKRRRMNPTPPSNVMQCCVTQRMSVSRTKAFIVVYFDRTSTVFDVSSLSTSTAQCTHIWWSFSVLPRILSLKS